MSREIKFRAWDKENKRWMTPSIEDGEESEVRLNLWGDTLFRLPWYEQEHGRIATVNGNSSFELFQFIGLEDKYRVEIYEGDIIKWGHLRKESEEKPHRIAEVKINPDIQFHSQVGVFHYGSFAYKDSTDKDIEIIGNIRENPELLEVD